MDPAETWRWQAASSAVTRVASGRHASAALQAVTMWAFDSFSAGGLQSGKPPLWFEAAHIHTRLADRPAPLAMP
jgi:hypothetical protein